MLMNSINVIYRKEVRRVYDGFSIMIREFVASGEDILSQSPAAFLSALVIIPFSKLFVRRDMNMRRPTQSKFFLQFMGLDKRHLSISH